MTDGHDDTDDSWLDDEFVDDEPPEPPGLRSAIVATLDVDDMFLQVVDTGSEGLVAFTAHAGRRSTAGLWDGDDVDLDPDRAIQRITDAWGYGPTRPVAASTVASVIGVLEGHPGTPFVDADSIELGGDPQTMHPPVEFESEGAVGVAFWTRSGRLSPYRATYLVRDGEAEVRRG